MKTKQTPAKDTQKIEKNKKVDEVIEDIQLAQVEAGGIFLRQCEIRKMTVEELLQLLIPNKVDFIIKFKK